MSASAWKENPGPGRRLLAVAASQSDWPHSSGPQPKTTITPDPVSASLWKHHSQVPLQPDYLTAPLRWSSVGWGQADVKGGIRNPFTSISQIRIETHATHFRKDLFWILSLPLVQWKLAEQCDTFVSPFLCQRPTKTQPGSDLIPAMLIYSIMTFKGSAWSILIV